MENKNKSADSDGKTPLIDHLKEQVTLISSPDFLAFLPNVEALGLDPLQFGPGIVVPDGGVLGLQRKEKEVEKTDLDDKKPVQEVGTSASSTFVPQERPQKGKEADAANAPPSSRKEAEEKIGEKDNQATEPEGALLPAKDLKRPYRSSCGSLNALDTELTNNKFRLLEGIGLHPPAPQAGPHPAPGIATGLGTGTESGSELGWPAAAGCLQPGAPAVQQAGCEQQVMSPTCDPEKRALGSSDSDIPADLLLRAGSKRLKEGPVGESEDQRKSIATSILDLKKEIKDEVSKEIKAEYGKLINQFNETARREIESNQGRMENMIKENLERQEEWGRTFMTSFQGLQLEVGRHKTLMEAFKDHVPRELREELTDTVEAFKGHIEARIGQIKEALSKHLEELTEAEKHSTGLWIPG